MNFEDLLNAWQCQKPGVKVTINDPEALRRDIRLTQRLSKIVNFWSDMFIVGVEAFLIFYFVRSAMRLRDWAGYLMAFVCFFIGAFILVDRWRQRRRQKPVTNETLVSCIRSSLVQVKHEIWRSKNIFWWYVLPLEIGFAAVVVSGAWHARGEGLGHALTEALHLAVFAFACGLIGWLVYWTSQSGRRKSLEPRRKELEELLVSLNENASDPSEPMPARTPSSRKTLLLTLLLLVAITSVVVNFVRTTPPAPVKIYCGLWFSQKA